MGDPLVDSGVTLEIDVSQSLTADGSALLETISPGKVKLKIDGPRIQLTPADIAGVFPAPGSEESPDEFLPHVPTPSTFLGAAGTCRRRSVDGPAFVQGVRAQVNRAKEAVSACESR